MSKLRLILGWMVVAASTASYGQSFPSKPIKIIVPAPPGASADVLANVLKQKLVEPWGQPLITENRVGDNANIGAEVAARSPGDGYTWILLPDSTMARSPHLGKLPFDVFKDFRSEEHTSELQSH